MVDLLFWDMALGAYGRQTTTLILLLSSPLILGTSVVYALSEKISFTAKAEYCPRFTRRVVWMRNCWWQCDGVNPPNKSSFTLASVSCFVDCTLTLLFPLLALCSLLHKRNSFWKQLRITAWKAKNWRQIFSWLKCYILAFMNIAH